jgi:flagellar protein FliO/FliZ
VRDRFVKKWIVILTACIVLFLSPLQVVVAADGTVYEQFEENPQQDSKPDLNQVEGTNVSIVPYVFKFIGSFVLIIALLFFVLKYLSKKTKMYQAGGPIHALGGHSLGNNRSLQMVMIGETLYIVGVGEDVNLIRTIPPGEEQTKLLASMAERPADPVSNWGSQIKKSAQEKWEDLFQNQLKELILNRDKNKDQSQKGEKE